ETRNNYIIIYCIDESSLPQERNTGAPSRDVQIVYANSNGKEDIVEPVGHTLSFPQLKET
ncbi:MAG TPA: hypothetical protein VIX38_04310, partial [Nitrososphaeraceae archaeon]